MIKKVNQLLSEYRAGNCSKNDSVIINCNGINGLDVYNPTAPFLYKGEVYMAGRVEARDSEDSQTMFFKQIGTWDYILEPAFGTYKLQDPFLTSVGSYYIFGGTETFTVPDEPGKLNWRTLLYYGKELEELKHLTYGPIGMKDIRLVDMKDSGVGLFTRPQGLIGGRGKIGFTKIKSLTDLTTKRMEEAAILEQFDDSEWGGCNEIIYLNNGKLGVLGHIAAFSEYNVRHYYPMVFCLDPETLTCSDIRIIAERKDFLPGPFKRKDLIDVLFSAGFIRHGNGFGTLYVGVSDAQIQAMDMEDPFIEYE